MGDYDTTSYVDFDPPLQSWPAIPTVIPISEFVGIGAPGIERTCMAYAKAQIAKKGYRISNYFDSTQTIQIYKATTGVNFTKINTGIGYLLSALHRGIPVIVGVDCWPGSSNPGTDNTTDHFIVIVGSGTDSNGNFFTFFDNSTSNALLGANPNNKLYYNQTTGYIRGRSQTYYGSQANYYTVTMIRKSK